MLSLIAQALKDAGQRKRSEGAETQNSSLISSTTIANFSCSLSGLYLRKLLQIEHNPMLS